MDAVILALPYLASTYLMRDYCQQYSLLNRWMKVERKGKSMRSQVALKMGTLLPAPLESMDLPPLQQVLSRLWGLGANGKDPDRCDCSDET